jgi:hypothetical protein
MTLETDDASPATEDHRRQSCDCCKNPTHLEPPFARFVDLFIGRLARRLKGQPRADTRPRHERLTVICPKTVLL